ncbi:MAG: helicase [Chloroflexi bacterium]|nr:helicase [Chloroflexota bacterium]
MDDYKAFLESKRLVVRSTGIDVSLDELNVSAKPHQVDLTMWALRKGRAAILATTGMGKTLMELMFGQQAAERSLILAPLAVAYQTVREGEKFGIDVTYARNESQAPRQGITVTNYELLEHFDPDNFGAVILDESGILKSFEGKTRTALIERFRYTPMRLCCSATPAPNDIAEIANHAEFLGIMTRVEMLAAFFVHDDKGWRLKGHAREPFYRWLASWAMSLQKPSDLGYSDDGYILPELTIDPIIIPSDYVPEGQLFAISLKGVSDRARVRKATMMQRVLVAADHIKAEPNEQWLVWVGLNDEGRELAKMIPSSVLVEGSQSPDEKADALTRFANGEIKVLISKVSIAGFGMNFQSCARMVFVGLGDSYEQYFQAIRRCWRFGQKRPVKVHIVLTDLEETIYENVLRKEKEAEATAAELVKHVAEFEKAEISTVDRGSFMYETKDESGQGWRFMLGDSSERLRELESHSVDLSIFSPPFLNLYTYSNTERDLGNSSTTRQFWSHFRFIIRELAQLTKPGRNVCVHVAQIAKQKSKDGVIGLRDFRGETVRHFERAGFVFHGEVCIDKDPQAVAIRTHSKGLAFIQLSKDASWMRPTIADYILVFRAPGENQVPIHPDITNDEWIEWARPIWYGIKEGETLNASEARSDDDERHICPLQLGTIERCIRLWSNPGELILSPFGGIASEGYQAIKLGRRFIGVELKPEYFQAGLKNLREAERLAKQVDLFQWAEGESEAVS